MKEKRPPTGRFGWRRKSDANQRNHPAGRSDAARAFRLSRMRCGRGHAHGSSALGKQAVVVVVPSCVAVIFGPFPNAAVGVPMFHSAFEIAAPAAPGSPRHSRSKGRRTSRCLPWPGTEAPLTLVFSPSPALRTGTRTSFMPAWTMRLT